MNEAINVSIGFTMVFYFLFSYKNFHVVNLHHEFHTITIKIENRTQIVFKNVIFRFLC